jgi:hypothetical protein
MATWYHEFPVRTGVRHHQSVKRTDEVKIHTTAVDIDLEWIEERFAIRWRGFPA